MICDVVLLLFTVSSHVHDLLSFSLLCIANGGRIGGNIPGDSTTQSVSFPSSDLLSFPSPFSALFFPHRSLSKTHEIIFSYLLLQKAIPCVVFREPMRKKNGTQTVAITIPKSRKPSDGMLLIPKTEVTKVRGRKNMDTFDLISLLSFF